MVAPGDIRPGIWRGGILQIHITRACDMACFGCTQGSNLRGKPVLITVEDFERACQSLVGYFGVVGIFGGNPAIHPQFTEICQILQRYFPKQQRGLWCNHPLGKAAIMRETFNPAYSNLNVHLNREAYEEFKLDWPEARVFGLTQESYHSPPFVAMQDVEPDESKRWEMISTCDVNQRWSAMLCSIPHRGLRGYFCELAGAQAMLHANDPAWPDLGVVPLPGWWQAPMDSYREQVQFYCHRCGMPLRRQGQAATAGEQEEVSATHADIYKAKDGKRPVKLVENYQARQVAHVTDYLQSGQSTGGPAW
jgi:organic radical activating enzyme